MRFKLEIECDNAAFRDDSERDSERDDGAAAAAEVSRILRHLAPRVEAGSYGPVLDVNGNTVGRWTFDDGEDR